MEAKDVFSLGLGLSEPWKLSGQRLDIEKRPNELHREVIADRGALFPFPECQRACTTAVLLVVFLSIWTGRELTKAHRSSPAQGSDGNIAA